MLAVSTVTSEKAQIGKQPRFRRIQAEVSEYSAEVSEYWAEVSENTKASTCLKAASRSPTAGFCELQVQNFKCKDLYDIAGQLHNSRKYVDVRDKVIETGVKRVAGYIHVGRLGPAPLRQVDKLDKLVIA